ncbi:MAG: SIR2 family NAD-dependent protein deacylase [Luteibaculaceae bacterium]
MGNDFKATDGSADKKINKPKLVVLTGAGISAESGLSTFRDSDGLWEKHNVMEVASVEGYQSNPELVNKFYNYRRTELAKVEPNAAHKALVELEQYFHTTIVTQNVDDLHERAGSESIIHLHGKLTEVCSTANGNLIKDIGYTMLNHPEQAPDKGIWRPNIVWFGELVPQLEVAAEKVREADVLMVVGTSLQVYPAASLVYYTKPGCQIFLVEPNEVLQNDFDFIHVKQKAVEGVPNLVHKLIMAFA